MVELDFGLYDSGFPTGTEGALPAVTYIVVGWRTIDVIVRGLQSTARSSSARPWILESPKMGLAMAKGARRKSNFNMMAALS